MDGFVSFDELQGFVFAEKLTPEIIRLGAKINPHILSSNEYADQYDVLLELKAENEKKVRQVVNNLAQSADSLKAQRDLIDDIMAGTGSLNEERPQGRGGRAQTNGLSQSR